MLEKIHSSKIVLYFWERVLKQPYPDHSNVLCQHVAGNVLGFWQNIPLLPLIFRVSLEYLRHFAINYKTVRSIRSLAKNE